MADAERAIHEAFDPLIAALRAEADRAARSFIWPPTRAQVEDIKRVLDEET